MRPPSKFLLFHRRRLLVNGLTGVITLSAAFVLWNWHGSEKPPVTVPGAGAEHPARQPATRDGLYLAGQAMGDGKPTLSAAEQAQAQAAQFQHDQAEIAAGVGRGMADWRLAIRDRNADMVEAMDRTFAEHPRDFIPALMVSAETDSDERVRAFSTRVLGKLRSVGSNALMLRLLGDASEYVRFNAVWALGELQDREAVAELRRLGKRDRSPMVRQAASESLRRIVGG